MAIQFNSPLELSVRERCTTSSTFLKALTVPLCVFFLPSVCPLSLPPSFSSACHVSSPSIHLFMFPPTLCSLDQHLPCAQCCLHALFFLYTCPIYTNLTSLLTERKVIHLPSLDSNSPNNKVSIYVSQ